jgi:tetratricopeptide (TPR) repeat protein
MTMAALQTPALQKALALHGQGKFAQAERAYLEILRQDPQEDRALHLLGVLVLQMDQRPRGIELIRQAIHLNPRRPLAHRDLGNALLQAGHFQAALASYDCALALKPDQADVLDNRGTALRMLNRPEEALESHDRALAVAPKTAMAHVNRGSALAVLNRLSEALESFDRALALDSHSALAHCNRGGALHRLERFGEALASHDRAVEYAPNLAPAHVSRGQTLAELGEHDQALAAFDRALALDPQSLEAQFGRAASLLVTGRFREGWPAFEARRGRVGPDAFHPAGRPQWTGKEVIAGKTLFIEAEQGLGDMIQFCRYAKRAADLGAHVILTARQSQLRLLRGLDPRIELRPDHQLPQHFDYHIPLMSMPMACDADEGDVSAEAPYLSAEPDRVTHWRSRIGDHGFKIGICWQGGPGNKARAFPLTLFAGIAARPRVRLISLQKGEGSEQLEACPFSVERLGEGYDAGPDSFLDAAAVMQTVDLVISCDTALAHLAGALARPVWVALKYAPDWRYLLNRDDSIWYPSMRLFRQRRPGDWQGAFAGLETGIDAILASRS